MRKIIGLLVAVVLVMGLATVAFAATDAGEHVITAEADIPTTITLAAGETATYSFEGDAAWAVFGKVARLSGDKDGKLWLIPGFWGNDLWEGVAEGYLEGHPMRGAITVAVENTGSETATYKFEVMGPVGSIGNPDTYLDLVWANWPNCTMDTNYEYYYTYTAGATAEILTISELNLDYSDVSNLNYNVVLTSENDEASMFNGVGYDESVSIGLNAGETAIITIRAAEIELMQGMVSVSFKASVAEAPAGSKVLPIEVSMLGDYIVEGDEVWYAINSMLAGNLIVVQGENAAIEIDGTVITAVDGLAVAVLNGEGATIAVKVTNADDMIIMPAPIEISAQGDYTVDVAAGAEVEIAVNSKLAGAILTVKGEGAYIYMNGTKYTAVDGVASAVLEGEGAVIAVKIGNASETAAQYALNIAYAPTEIAAAGDYKVTLAAGAEAQYAVNSKLAGYVVTVKGEGAYLIINGTKVEAKNGVATATLEGAGATIKLVVGNAGTATGEWTVNIAAVSNDETGDFGVIAAVVALATSAIGGTAVIAKKKEN